MKKTIALLALTLSMASFAQSNLEYTVASSTAVTVSPFVYATRIVQGTSALTTGGPLLSTMMSAERRGVAGKDQLRDELAALNADMSQGLVKSLDEVRQPTLKEYMQEIAADEEQMKGIHEAIPQGSELLKISTAVTITLLNE